MGNTFVRETAVALIEAGLLAEHWTALDWPADERRWAWLPESARRQMRRRRLPDAVKPLAHLRPWRELGRLFGPRLGCSGWAKHEAGWCSADRVMQDLDKRVAKRLRERAGLTGVYLYEDGAADTFAVARERGVRTIYDLPIGHWREARKLLTEEAARRPEWANTLHGNRDSQGKLERKDRELALADEIVVASSFTRATLAQAPGVTGRVTVVPYGASFGTKISPVRQPPRPGVVRVLFVGSLGQRKGVADLLDAVAMLGKGAELTLIGIRPAADCPPLDAALRLHRWIPSCPHEEVLRLMGEHDVLVFPSLFEGFGLVILEAMAQGTPVITTPHTAGPDIITSGRDGLLVPIRDPMAIAHHLELLRRNPDQVAAMGAAAQQTARNWLWAGYRAGISTLARRALGII